jgi:hypothetical protein
MIMKVHPEDIRLVSLSLEVSRYLCNSHALLYQRYYVYTQCELLYLCMAKCDPHEGRGTLNIAPLPQDTQVRQSEHCYQM